MVKVENEYFKVQEVCRDRDELKTIDSIWTSLKVTIVGAQRCIISPSGRLKLLALLHLL